MAEPIKLGPIIIETELDTSGALEDIERLFSGDALDRMESFGDAFGELSDELAGLIDEMFNLEDASQSMVIGVSAAFDGLKNTIGSVGDAYQQMLLTGEISLETFGAALKASVAQELAALSAKALINAIFATAVGLLNLALFQFPAAAQAFAAAATFGAVAVAAGVGALALSAGGRGGAGEDAGFGGGPSRDQTDPLEQQNQQRFLHIEIHGNLIGQEEYVLGTLIPEINKQISENDAVMLSTSTTAEGSVSGVQT